MRLLAFFFQIQVNQKKKKKRIFKLASITLCDQVDATLRNNGCKLLVCVKHLDVECSLVLQHCVVTWLGAWFLCMLTHTL